VDELRHTVQHHSITHVRSSTLELIWNKGLRWDNQFDYMPVYVAPMTVEVRAWGRTLLRSSPVDPVDASDDTSYGAPNRVMTLGAARFIANRAVSPVAVSAYSPNGLRSVEIYDGERLHRRFGPIHGPHSFYRTVLLNGVVQRNLVLVVTDLDGNKAVNYAFRQ
jgi:hypothetical protein